ncbi:rod shape-determining protein MreC [Ferrovum sp.]|uniref:rod shape-determining protein MreC n=1 Tax=Ferrovum sp. TaxID=2609467 RepID=UPI00261353ED|nr:rod shape-determining protein MreC [Ferrovum sp.]
MSPLKSRPSDLFSQPTPLWLRSGIYGLIALTCILFDHHYHRLERVHQILRIWTLPFQELARVPLWTEREIGRHLTTLERLQAENNALRHELLGQAALVQQAPLLNRDLTRLRALMQLGSSPRFTGQVCRIIGSARNPFVQKVLLEGGESQGIRTGSPVLTDQGLMGQITRVYPDESEVTLISNRNLTIPVEIERTGLRTLAMGTGHQGELSLPYVPSETDVRVGDLLLTSGIDGLYPRGLTVATLTSVTHHPSSAFVEITARVNAGTDTYPDVLVMTSNTSFQNLRALDNPPLSPIHKKP